ncbi:PAP2 superfamily protein [Nocardioides dokdonensis FR1436]|uniref:PAP2 superfamily protein n=1 Tax=Nocardioides dokdonensis FR1436 TaxID=1300347 RepID=A0A1A9GHQ9_9ACTN|nr:phosphatase PAP2 family protein [Nocardioides dokdonensis]ANH37005.1 PAP2 superfamily protein [Nocardioides dokdonensis FR1436]
MSNVAADAAPRTGTPLARALPAVREVGLLAVLYLGYTASRLLASDDAHSAREVAGWILEVQQGLGIAVEAELNGWTAAHVGVGVAASYWYSVTHYAVTGLVLLGIWLRRPDTYRTTRTVLVAATLTALACYLAVPVAPPRLMPGYVDVLAQTAPWGWWGGSASAPRGLGSMTNQLAAMPSMHVGWAVWVALALSRVVPPSWRRAVWAYPVLTTVVVVLTGNHWVLDAVAGAAVVLLVDRAVRAWAVRRGVSGPARPPAPR